MKEIYFDNAATTQTSLEAAKIAYDIMTKNYGNPSSKHLKGLEAEKEIKKAIKIISNIIDSNESEIYFTSGATEANNTSIFGTAYAYKREGKHIITTKIEHPSVMQPFKILEENGFNVTYLDVDSDGLININQLVDSITDNTILVSIIHVNNEIGSVQNIDQIGKLIKQKNKNTLFHVDAVQSFGKYNISVKKSNIDLLSVSGHKFHAPKGIGFLYIKKGIKTKALIYGGGQQNNMRSGTENVSGIASLATAAQEAYKNIDINFEKVKLLKSKLAAAILNNINETYINGTLSENASPYILNISFKDIKSEVLLHALENENISVSSGSACSSHKSKPSNTLKAINSEYADEAIRFSFSKYNTVEDVDYCIDVLNKLIPKLRNFDSIFIRKR